jgi:hypothetical protein
LFERAGEKRAVDSFVEKVQGIVMAGLVPAIHVFLSGINKDADARA